MNTKSKIAAQIKSTARLFKRNTSGVAAIEFAFLAPILMLMTFGTFEVGRAVIVHKRLQRATDMVADLVAREQSLGPTLNAVQSNLNGIMKAAEHSIWPYDNTKMRMRIMSVRAGMTSPFPTSVVWIYGYRHTPSVSCGAQKSLPETGMVVPGNAVIMVESEYDYKSISNNIFPDFMSPMTFKDTMVYSPRNACVDVAGTNCADNTCLQTMLGP